MMLPLAWILQGFPRIEPWLDLKHLLAGENLWGILYGLIVGLIMILATSNDEATQSFKQQIQLVRSLKLTIFDCLLLSLCAGIGEEFLFRIALQEWLHPLIVSVVFVAIHGYLNPRDWSTTKYGLLVLVFIIGLGYAVDFWGIWFCIFAHAAYDFSLFYYWSRRLSL